MNGNEVVVVVVGFACLIAANFISAFANIQLKRHAHLTAECPENARVTRKYLIVGVVLSVIAGLMDLLVIGSIPLTYRACSAPLSIPSNVIVARLTLREKVGYRRGLGIVLTFIGCMEGAMSMGTREGSGSETFSRPAELLPVFLLAGFGICALLADLVSLFKPKSFPCISVFSAACGVAFIAGCSTMCGKLLSMVGRTDILSFEMLFSTLGCVGFAALQLSLLSRMLGRFEVSTCMPTYQIMTMVWLSLLSFFVFGEDVSNGAGFLAGFATSAVGVYIVASGDQTGSKASPDASPLFTAARIKAIK